MKSTTFRDKDIYEFFEDIEFVAATINRKADLEKMITILDRMIINISEIDDHKKFIRNKLVESQQNVN